MNTDSTPDVNGELVKLPSKDKKAEPEGNGLEMGGRKNGMDPTRYGDWELNGRCIDF